MATDLKSGWLQAYEQSSAERLWAEEPLRFLADYLDLIAQVGRHGVLDIGCGEGRNLEFFAKAGLPTIGLDLSKVALERARRNAVSKGICHVALLQGDIDNLPFPFLDNSISVVTCLDVFGQLIDPSKAVERVQQLLRPGGLFLANLYTINDATYGCGEKLGDNAFVYKNTLFRFFEEAAIKPLFASWDVLSVSIYSWVDPPHPGYRDEEHTHESFVVLVRKRS